VATFIPSGASFSSAVVSSFRVRSWNSELPWAFSGGAIGENISPWVENDLMTTRKPVLGSASRWMLLGLTVAAAPLLARCAVPSVDYPVARVQCDSTGEFMQRLMIPNVPNSLMCLDDVAGVNSALFNTPVIDAYGYRVGRFRRVEVKAPGDVVAVITLNNSLRTIAVVTDHVRYEPGMDLMIADLTAVQLDRIPSGFPYG
jgi:hypothetical protein